MKRTQWVAIAGLAGAVQFSAGEAKAADIAYDMVGSTSVNLISHNNAFENAFGSAGDGFQKYQRGVSPSIPFAVVDDSLSVFTSDTLGIIDETNLDEFFGVTDTVNGDNPSGNVTATWTFDVSSATSSALAVSIDMGAMGDFESSDTFTWYVSIDGGAQQLLFSGAADEAASKNYTLSGGTVVALNDPMTLDGVELSNLLQTFTANVSGNGSTLALTLEANTNGGSEAFAFQNIRISDDAVAPPPPPPAPPLVKIHEVQGAGSASPLVSQIVTIEGVVVGDFQDGAAGANGDLNGFYVQEEDADADGSPATSEGIFVFDGSSPTVDVATGDVVRVTGEVKEFFGLTEIDAEAVVVNSSNATLPLPTDISLPVSSLDDHEAFEGMLVRFPQQLVISEYFNFDRFGEMVLAQPLPGEQRPLTPAAVEVPGSLAYEQRADANARSRITLDDGRTVQNPDPASHPNGNVFDLNNRFRGGDLVQNASGILDYRFGLYRIQPTNGADYTPMNPRSEDTPVVGGDLKVAAFNVLNYFTTLDEGRNLCGPSAIGCRGADNATEFQRQRDKIISALAILDADVVGLMELENNAVSAIADLVAGLNSAMGPGTYAHIDTGTIGGDAIKVGFIYKPATVTAVGNFAVLDSSVDPTFIDTLNRPALAQTFQVVTGARFTAVVNHFKSKGSACDGVGDPDLGDGQGNCNGTRTDAAAALADWLATDPTNSGDADVLILGDLNAYDKEDPIAVLTSAGYTDLLLSFEGEEAYTYVFDGQFGYLDYALANTPMLNQITGAAAWHINADEPDILDYNTDFKKLAQVALYESNAFRSSDHDPVIVGLNLNAPPSCNGAMASTEILWPPDHKLVSVGILGVTDPDGDAVSVVVDSVFQDEPVKGVGDGKTVPDAVLGLSGDGVSVRAERSGTGNGRVYYIGFTATDTAGASCSGEVTVGVPVDRKKTAMPVDDGPLFDSTLN